jgi:hypothetical protein
MALQPFVANQLETIHDALRSEIGSEIAAVPELALPASWRSFTGPTRPPVFLAADDADFA